MFAFALSLQKLSYVAEIVTGAAVVFGFAQVWQARRDGQVALITGMTTLILEVDRVFIEYPEMRKYFGDDAISPKGATEEAERARAVAMTMADMLDHVAEHLDLMRDDTQRAWRAWVAETLEKTPALEELMVSHGDWWPSLRSYAQGDRARSRRRWCLSRAHALPLR